MTQPETETKARERFAQAEQGNGAWLEAASAYAATAEGHRTLVDDLLPLAVMLGDDER